MARRTKATFNDQTRFNWGYHDAAQAVREGWSTPQKNYGFGLALTIAHPDDVQAQHPDKSYAAGWRHGYEDATLGYGTKSSEQAWLDHTATVVKF